LTYLEKKKFRSTFGYVPVFETTKAGYPLHINTSIYSHAASFFRRHVPDALPFGSADPQPSRTAARDTYFPHACTLYVIYMSLI